MKLYLILGSNGDSRLSEDVPQDITHRVNGALEKIRPRINTPLEGDLYGTVVPLPKRKDSRTALLVHLYAKDGRMKDYLPTERDSTTISDLSTEGRGQVCQSQADLNVCVVFPKEEVIVSIPLSDQDPRAKYPIEPKR